MILSAALSVVNCCWEAIGTAGWEYRTANLFTSGNANSMLFSAIFISLFLGTDYSNGTIRNKLMIGSTRTRIYLSNLVTTAAGGLLIAAARCIPCAVTACFGKEFGMSEDEFIFKMSIVVCAIAAMSAIFTLLGMSITSRSANAAVTITSAFVLILGSAIIMSILEQPEYISVYEATENGITLTDPRPNPAYVSGTKRGVLTTVNDVLPSGQVMQMEAGVLHNKELMPLYSLGAIAVTTAAGAVVFRKKDLK